MKKIVDLFAGCGGLTLGFQKAGFDVIFAADNWEKSNIVYEQNFSHPIVNLDLSDVDKTVDVLKNKKFDGIIGGPPCQDFSHAGKRNEDGGKGGLTVSFAQIIGRLKPSFFVMENVDRLTMTRKYDKAYELFKKYGYGLNVVLLDASYFNVPQKRKRYFVIGLLGEEDDVLINYIMAQKSPKPMTMRDYFGNKLGIEHYYRHPRNYNRRGIFSMDEPSPTIRGVNRPIPPGYTVHQGDTCKDIEKVRPLTTLERAQVQTFPVDYKLNGAKTHLEQMIGNAVPVNLAFVIANSLCKYWNDYEESHSTC